MRDELEQQAANFELRVPEDKKAVNEYLADIQNSDVTPEYLLNRTQQFCVGQILCVEMKKSPMKVGNRMYFGKGALSWRDDLTFQVRGAFRGFCHLNAQVMEYRNKKVMVYQ